MIAKHIYPLSILIQIILQLFIHKIAAYIFAKYAHHSTTLNTNKFHAQLNGESLTENEMY